METSPSIGAQRSTESRGRRLNGVLNDVPFQSQYFFSIRKMDLVESGKFKLVDFMTVGHCSLREFIRSIDSAPAR